MLDRVVNTMINAKLPEPDRVGQRLELHIQAEPLTLHKHYTSEITVRPARLILRAAEWSDRHGARRLYWVFDRIVS